MKSALILPLQVSPAQASSLQALQALFAEACNHLAPLVRETRCWNRVALHHLGYRALREKYPQLGSQMACNVIYALSRAARIVYQHPRSPWCIARHPAVPVPLLQFLPSSPVYFDKHTLSLKEGRLSLFTLDGRMHFRFDLAPAVADRFRTEKLREIALRRQGEAFALHCQFAPRAGSRPAGQPAWQALPEYLTVREEQPEPAIA